MHFIQKNLDRYTMYQVLTSILGFYVLYGLVLSLAGVIIYPLGSLLVSLAVIISVVLLTHYLLVALTKAPANVWSSVITGLILFLLFTPASTPSGLLTLAIVSASAIALKYVVKYRNVHLFNPVALAAVLAGLLGLAHASWWVGTLWFAPVLIVGGLIISLKIRRLHMVLMGVAASLLMVLLYSVIRGEVGVDTFIGLLAISPLWFFMTIMVTEPLSTPAGNKAQLFYGAFIGLLSQIPFAIGPIFNSPELTLVIANLLVWPMTLRGRLTLTCLKVEAVARNTFAYTFQPSFPVRFTAGQYLEWALPHSSPDGRGTRRYFTVASGPQKKNLKLVVRMAEAGSTFKQSLHTFARGSVLHAAQLAGDFVLPSRIDEHKYVFVAGGIGITPFLSHLEFVQDTQQVIDVTLFYCNNHLEDIAYAKKLKDYESLGVQTVHVLQEAPPNWDGESGYLTKEMVKASIPDVAARLVYLSGPPGMVQAYESLFTSLGVPKKNIKTDYFPGLA
jgi:ferredoxin-NADP reductase/Na+-transporting NADH:ubiquinone oxidoreductase subunit NqrB